MRHQCRPRTCDVIGVCAHQRGYGHLLPTLENTGWAVHPARALESMKCRWDSGLVPVNLLRKRLISSFQRSGEPVARLEEQGKVDLVAVRVIQVEVPRIAQTNVVPDVRRVSGTHK